MKKLISIICAAAVFISVAVCCVTFFSENKAKQSISSTTNTVFETAEVSTEEAAEESQHLNINRASAMADYAIVYESEEEKLSDNKLSVVSGKVIKTEVVLSESVYTCCTVKINKVIKGKFDTDEILVLEPGGFLDSERAEKFMDKPGAKSPDGMYVDYDGYVPAAVGDEVIFFVYKCEPWESISKVVDYKNAYHTAGCVQGKLTLKNGKYVSATPEKLVESFKNTDYKISTKSFAPAEFEQMAKRTVRSAGIKD